MEAGRTLTFTGQVTDTETLLDGRRAYTLVAQGHESGSDADTGMELTLSFVWDPVGGVPVDEGDLTLIDADHELQGVVSHGQVEAGSDPDTGDERVHFDLEGRLTEGMPEPAAGAVDWSARGEMAGDDVTVELELHAELRSE